MTVQAKTLMPSAAIVAAATTQYTAPANTRTIIDKMTVTNTTGAAVTVTVYIVTAAGASGTSNRLIAAQSIAAGTAYLREWHEDIEFEGGTRDPASPGLSGEAMAKMRRMAADLRASRLARKH